LVGKASNVVPVAGSGAASAAIAASGAASSADAGSGATSSANLQIRSRVVKQTVWDASSIEESEAVKAVPCLLNPFDSSAGAAPKMMQLRTNVEWDDDAPFFYFLPREVVLLCSAQSLPPMQALRDVGHLVKFQIPLGDAFQGKGVVNQILFVSHRWESLDQPDADGEQLKAIKAYLEENPDIEWVWFDYSTLPQRFYDRSPEEMAEFKRMLSRIDDLNLTAHVLILLDGSYASRFWTLIEAWESMQTATPEGLRPATKAERRYTIKCIHNATDKHDGEGLVDKVLKKTPEEMFDLLKQPDVIVTNARDKEMMLPKIRESNRHVVDTFQKQVILPEP
jgi:hypothetical protein